MRLLELRFGPLSPGARAQIDAADAARRARCLDALFTAAELDALLRR